jgi:nucleoside diphosphate kinase
MKGAISKSFFIIKPEALAKRKEIIDLLNKHLDLIVVESKRIKLKESDIDKIYFDDFGTLLLNAIKMHLVDKFVEVGMVEGRDAVIALRQACGTEADPKLCNKNTIRYIFGLPNPVWYNGQKYYLNAIHSAVESEVEASLEWFEKQK